MISLSDLMLWFPPAACPAKYPSASVFQYRHLCSILINGCLGSSIFSPPPCCLLFITLWSYESDEPRQKCFYQWTPRRYPHCTRLLFRSIFTGNRRKKSRTESFSGIFIQPVKSRFRGRVRGIYRYYGKRPLSGDGIRHPCHKYPLYADELRAEPEV